MNMAVIVSSGLWVGLKRVEQGDVTCETQNIRLYKVENFLRM